MIAIALPARRIRINLGLLCIAASVRTGVVVAHLESWARFTLGTMLGQACPELAEMDSPLARLAFNGRHEGKFLNANLGDSVDL